MWEHANRTLKELSFPLVCSSSHKQLHRNITQTSILVNQSHGWSKNTGLVTNSIRFRSSLNVDVENKNHRFSDRYLNIQFNECNLTEF